MSKPSSLQIRQLRDQFRKERNHAWSAPSPLIKSSKEDATTLFNVAGMQPLVPYLMGKEHPDGKRLYNIQACIRTPDIEDIGDERHLTCFEMMGNRSLGDYFKVESITRSIEFLTKYAGIPLERLWATIFAGDETAKIPFDTVSQETLENMGITHIKQMKFDEHRTSDNFWTPGPVGPCGPCCEIYYDRGDDYGPADWDMGENDRYTEIWNNVFMAYYDDGSGNLVELPAKNVDTGMGFERLMMVVQDVDTIYETDIFLPTLALLQKVAAHDYPGFLKKTFQCDVAELAVIKSYRVVADHLRASALLLHEGLTPSNEGRGYVLRRLIRRVWYHINKLAHIWTKITQRNDFPVILSELVTSLLMMYPETKGSLASIVKWLVQEMTQFESTVIKGEALLQQYFQTPGKKELTGEEVFKMYDTYGIPMELTKEVAASVGMSIDQEGYHHHLEAAKEKSRQGSKKMFDKGIDRSVVVEGMPLTKFIGYERLESSEMKLLKDVEVEGRRVLIFDQTPMYAEGWGQIGDRGIVTLDSGEALELIDVQRYAGVYLHFVG
jgi:alanyl-tRNA synthetase